MKILLRSLAALAALFLVLAAVVYAILRQPSPLELPQRGFTLRDVTVINPGVDRSAHRSLVVAGSQIDSIGAALDDGSHFEGAAYDAIVTPMVRRVLAAAARFDGSSSDDP